MSLNRTIIEGAILNDLEIKGTDEHSVLTLFVGVNQNYKAKDEQYPKSNSFMVKAFGKTANFINTYFKKQDHIIVEGELDINEEYTKPDGSVIPSTVFIKTSAAYFAGNNKNTSDDSNSTTTATPTNKLGNAASKLASKTVTAKPNPFSKK